SDLQGGLTTHICAGRAVSRRRFVSEDNVRPGASLARRAVRSVEECRGPRVGVKPIWGAGSSHAYDPINFRNQPLRRPSLRDRGALPHQRWGHIGPSRAWMFFGDMRRETVRRDLLPTKPAEGL